MPFHPSAAAPARALRVFLSGASAAAVLAAMPAAALAGPADLEVVVTRAKTVERTAPNVVTFAIRNTGAEAFDPQGAGLVPGETAVFFESSSRSRYSVAARSNPGWSCQAGGGDGVCRLDHTIPAGGSSLPVEIEVIPSRAAGAGAADLDADLSVDGQVAAIPPAGEVESAIVRLPVSIPAADAAERPDAVHLQWRGGAGDHARGPVVLPTASATELEGDATAAVGFAFKAQDQISTGPYAPFSGLVEARGAEGRAWPEGAGTFPDVQLALDVPAGAEIVGPVRWFGLLPENGRLLDRGIGRGALDREAQFGEAEFQVGTETPGQYVTTLPSGTRLLPGHPVRVVFDVKLAPGVDTATITGEASAPSEAIESSRSGRAAGRALLADPAAARATVTLTRKKAPVPTPTPSPADPTPAPSPSPAPSDPTPTNPVPAPAPVPTPAPVATPTPDGGGVLAERAQPRLVGRAVFRKKTIRVGKQTTLDVTVRNAGNAGSDAGRVCVRLSAAIVVVKMPKGVTNKGAVLCANRSAISANGTLTVRGVGVRGVTATPSATARDGADDGVELTGDRLAVLRGAVRPGGVTG